MSQSNQTKHPKPLAADLYVNDIAWHTFILHGEEPKQVTISKIEAALHLTDEMCITSDGMRISRHYVWADKPELRTTTDKFGKVTVWIGSRY